MRPVYVGADGRASRGEVSVHLAGGTSQFAHSITLDHVRVFDWDGDGRAELYFHEVHAQEENGNEVLRQERWWTFTARDGVPREFTRDASRAVTIEDVDGDRRPDLVLRSPWVSVGPCGIAEVDQPGPRQLLHSLPDGTFSADDAVAQGFIAHQCRERPTRILTEPVLQGDASQTGDEQPTFRIGCARWWGLPMPTLMREMMRTYGATADAGDSPLLCYPPGEMLRVADIAPPVAFRLQCGGR